jgi:hypothetical protein
MKVFRDSKQNQAKTTVSNESSSNSTTNNLLDKLSKKVYTLGTSSGLLEKRPEQQNQVQCINSFLM